MFYFICGNKKRKLTERISNDYSSNTVEEKKEWIILFLFHFIMQIKNYTQHLKYETDKKKVKCLNICFVTPHFFCFMILLNIQTLQQFFHAQMKITNRWTFFILLNDLILIKISTKNKRVKGIYLHFWNDNNHYI